MVALVSSTPAEGVADWQARARGGMVWAASAVGVAVLGALMRLAIGGTGVGERSAVVMLAIVAACVWAGASALKGPRTALAAVAVVAVLFDLAGLPQRSPPPYDDLQAFYATDQVLQAQLPVDGEGSVLTLLAQPVFVGSAPRFGLAGDVNGAALAWTCSFERGIQQIALPLPADLLRGASQADVRLHLTGSPAHDGDYLVAYMSSRQGGFVMSIGSAASVDPSATHCALR